MIFYAKHKDKIVGTVSLLKIDKTTFELSKMAVTECVQGLGIGNKLMKHCIDTAKQKSIKKLLLYSNKKLLSAIYLYEKFNFKEVALEEGVYNRANIKMELTI